ncbi:MAG: hypothetical protein HKN79_00440, partial [Flavobacteriales bacterium]|nr:hypothetical protein [Flavobacteriales bacterium]
SHLKGESPQGHFLGEEKGGHFIPSTFLARSGLLTNPEHVEFDLHQALAYLRRETFPLNSEISDGWYIVRFNKAVLGWMKVAAGKMKNHYPKRWMIRKRW